MSAENEDVRVSRENRNALNSRQPINEDEGELVVDSTSPLPGQIVCRPGGQAEQERSGGQAEQGRSGGQAEQASSGGQAEQERSGGQAEQQRIGMHLWAPGGSTFYDDVTVIVTTALPPVPAQVVDVIRYRRSPFPPGEVDPALPAVHAEASGTTRAVGFDGFISTSGSRELQKEEEENWSLRDRFYCKICLENPIDAVFTPCGHRFSCLHCSQRSLEELEQQGQPRRCVVCRREATITPVQRS